MKATNDLYQLIRSLTKSEKRYFKMYSSVYSGRKIYFRLFDAMAKQKRYDEGKLLIKFKGYDFTKQFSVAKNQLYRQILYALETYHQSVHSEVKSLLRWAEILYEKGLYTQSHKVLKKTKQLAREHEMHHVMIEIFRQWEMNLALKNADVSWMQNILCEEREELSLLQNTQEYRGIYFRMAVYHLLHGTARDKKQFGQVKQLMRSSFLTDEHKAKTFEAKLRFYDARSFYFKVINDTTNQYLSVKNIIAHFKKHPEKIRHNVSALMVYLNNMLHTCTIIQRYNEMPLYLKELELLLPLARSSDEKRKIFFFTAINRLNYYVITGQFSIAVSAVTEIIRKLKEHEQSANSLEKAALFHNIALAYFGAEGYKNCIYWLNRLRNENPLNVRPDLENFLRLLYLIAQYEAGNMNLLPSLIRSAYRFLRKKEQLYKFETILIDFFRNELPKTNIKGELLQAFQKFRDKIAPLSKNPFEKNAFEFFDYISWLESKIENRTFADVVRQKAKSLPDSI